ncbi:MAG: cell division protein FtsW [Clostridia bacterium]|nr:cell division protein FtsW [Clostridia bacterium]
MPEKTIRRKRLPFVQSGKVDLVFLSLVLVLLTVGLVMLFSASYASSYAKFGKSYVFILHQFKLAVAGVVLMLVVSKIDYHVLRYAAWPIFGISFILLVFLLISPPMGENTNVKRWFIKGPINFQPSEVAKFAIILLFALLISANYSKMKKISFVGFLSFLLLSTAFLVYKEPHISATVVIVLIGFVLMFVGGLGLGYVFFGFGLVGIAGIYVILSGKIAYALERVTYWINPWSDPLGKGFQTIQSMMAIGSGGILGRGLGQSRQKYLWLPEPQNDFIFAVVCEELGLIGALIIIALFILLAWRGFNLAMRAPDKFGTLLCLGLTFQVTLQAMLNILVVSNLMPNTGISLPFFSYGGTSLLMLLGEMGIVLSISRDVNLEKG